jgi:sulfide:quinone oxidoreductase
MKRLVILGGGTAGTMVANRLRAAIPVTDLSITVVDRDDVHYYQPGFLLLPFGTYRGRDVVASRQKQLAQGIDLVYAEIDRVEPTDHAVRLADGRRLDYDQLIVATGVTPRPDQTPGLLGEQWGVTVHEFYTAEGAQRLAEALRHFRAGRVVVHLTDMPIKCPVAPLEFTFLMDAWLRQHGVRQRCQLTYVTPLDGAFTRPVSSRLLSGQLDARDIGLETDFAVAALDNEARQLVGYDGRRLDFDLLVTIPLNMGADYIARSDMGDDLNLVPCDQQTMKALHHDDIWVMGDAGTLSTSKAGSVAHFATDVFVKNFLATWRGQPASHAFDGHSNCFVEMGDRKAMLLDFNYETQPYPGTFPLPVVGPFALLKPSLINHLGKLAFRFVYWHLLLPGRPLPLPSAMSRWGKRIVPDEAGPTSGPLFDQPHQTSAPGPAPAAPRSAPTAQAPTAAAPAGPPAATSTASARPAARPAATTGPPRAAGQTQTIGGRAVAVDAEGFLTDYGQWDEDLAQELARLIGIELTDEHFGPIRFLRADFPTRGETATLRRVGTIGGFEIARLFQLFPGKPAKKMAYIAGLPKPRGCV